MKPVDTKSIERGDFMNRGQLRKLVEAGVMEAKISYDYDGRVVTSADTPGNDWKPVRIMGLPTVDHAAITASPTHSAWLEQDWKEGYYNFMDIHFKSKSGRLSEKEPGLWELYYAGTRYLLRRKETDGKDSQTERA